MILWSPQRFWLYVAAPCSGILLRFLVRDQLGTWQDALFSACFALIVALVGTYLINLIRAPSLIHREQAAVLDELEARTVALETENRDLRRPRVSRLQQTQFDLVKHKLENSSNEARQTVEYLLLHGEVSWSEFRSLIAKGIPDSAIQNRMAEAKRTHLVQERFDQTERQRVWFVRPELKDAIERYFEEQHISRR